MLVIQTLGTTLRQLPLLMVIGLAVMVVGGVLDVVIHLGPADHDHHVPEGFYSEHLAHLVGVAGMSIVLAGLVMHGARRHHRRRGHHGGEHSHAYR